MGRLVTERKFKPGSGSVRKQKDIEAKHTIRIPALKSNCNSLYVEKIFVFFIDVTKNVPLRFGKWLYPTGPTE
jgi:hypothetical protein